MNQPIRVIVVDDHPVIRLSIRQMLESTDDISVVGEGSNGGEALDLVEELHPDVLLLDIEMPGLSGLEVARQLHETDPDVRVVGVSAHSERHHIYELLAHGAAGYVTKEEAVDTLDHAVRAIAHGKGVWLSFQAAACLTSM